MHPLRHNETHKAKPELPALLLGISVLVSSVLVGGNTTTFSVTDAVAEALALPALSVAVLAIAFKSREEPFPSTLNAALLFCCFTVALPLIQLLPLPPSIWPLLPGRWHIADGYKIAGVALPWLGISLSPSATWKSLLSLGPALAMFILTVQMTWGERRIAVATLLCLGLLSEFVGLLQLIQGPGSIFRFYNTSHSDIVGFFANHNHLGVLFYICLLFSSIWGLSLISILLTQSRRNHADASNAATSLLFAFLSILFLLGAVLTRSRAAVIFCAATGALVISLVIPFAIKTKRRIPIAVLMILFALSLIVFSNYAIFDLINRFHKGLDDVVRSDISKTTRLLTTMYIPVGTGFGTFLPIYASHETPLMSQIAVVNRAHNDFLEWLVEGSIPACLIILYGLFWVFWICVLTVREAPSEHNLLNQALRRAAAFGLILELIHSTVDYPLRTIALMSVTGLLAGLCIEPLGAAGESQQRLGARKNKTTLKDVT